MSWTPPTSMLWTRKQVATIRRVRRVAVEVVAVVGLEAAVVGVSGHSASLARPTPFPTSLLSAFSTKTITTVIRPPQKGAPPSPRLRNGNKLAHFFPPHPSIEGAILYPLFHSFLYSPTNTNAVTLLFFTKHTSPWAMK